MVIIVLRIQWAARPIRAEADKFGEQFSFDLEVFAKYSPKGKNRNSIKAAQLTRDISPTSTIAGQTWYTQQGTGTGRRNILL